MELILCSIRKPIICFVLYGFNVMLKGDYLEVLISLCCSLQVKVSAEASF